MATRGRAFAMGQEPISSVATVSSDHLSRRAPYSAAARARVIEPGPEGALPRRELDGPAREPRVEWSVAHDDGLAGLRAVVGPAGDPVELVPDLADEDAVVGELAREVRRGSARIQVCGAERSAVDVGWTQLLRREFESRGRPAGRRMCGGEGMADTLTTVQLAAIERLPRSSSARDRGPGRNRRLPRVVRGRAQLPPSRG